MIDSKQTFIQLALDHQALKFGDFTLKSGRKSPYFFNAGLFFHGEALSQLGILYANALIESKLNFDHLFGPAYKGIPLATSTVTALAKLGKNSTLSFNRKEAKTHGEGGQLIGAPLLGRTVIVDDVITAGTAFREAQKLITECGSQITGVIVALDRCERGFGKTNVLNEIEAQGIKVISLITVFDLIKYLQQNGKLNEAERIVDHQKKYAAS